MYCSFRGILLSLLDPLKSGWKPQWSSHYSSAVYLWKASLHGWCWGLSPVASWLLGSWLQRPLYMWMVQHYEKILGNKFLGSPFWVEGPGARFFKWNLQFFTLESVMGGILLISHMPQGIFLLVHAQITWLLFYAYHFRNHKHFPLIELCRYFLFGETTNFSNHLVLTGVVPQALPTAL